MAYMSTFNSSGLEGFEVEYDPAHLDDGRRQPAYVRIHLTGTDAHVGMQIEEARQLATTLQNVIMLHDSAERLAAEKAVGGGESDSVSQPVTDKAVA
nr:hypothetical protein [Nocardia terpenica]